jgi:hypothetical protein
MADNGDRDQVLADVREMADVLHGINPSAHRLTDQDHQAIADLLLNATYPQPAYCLRGLARELATVPVP